MKKVLDRLDKKCIEISRYNKLHNTHYSYGEYSALVREGKIRGSEKAGEKKKAGKK
ncbi:hypothetical protein LCN94_01465 [Ruminococcus sp. FMB-CY1]|uniref:hypothetical protein n=1 Tax=unclassified Ruminococcus TaxID=2608920 RepID=UPI00208F4190|nr:MULTISPECIES: hypothetical protein [unclassified Ruminococcus]USP68894.1 hypothetical protein KGF34_06840 [Ruminococcus sp. FMBCY1]WBX57803.1 hypothetical protein LCN94_01465 [Ruminococcus sp. FMB-CY1]